MWKDPLVEEIRQIRDQYAKRFNYDLDAIVRDLMDRQEKSGRELVSLPPKPAQTAGKIVASEK